MKLQGIDMVIKRERERELSFIKWGSYKNKENAWISATVGPGRKVIPLAISLIY